PRRGGAHRVRHGRRRSDRVRGLPVRPDRGAHRRAERIAHGPGGAGGRAARPALRPHWTVRLRRALPGRRHHRRPRGAVPRVPSCSHQSLGRFAVTDTHVLRVEGVTLAYGERTVVESLDLLVPPGRITAIIGANACGKSTLLRAMS